MHLFDLYRRLLMIVLGVYGTIRLTQAAWRLSARLRGPSRHVRVLRGYVALLALRVRLHRFGAELLQILALAVLLGVLLYAHRL
ncbi:MAG: hypothetical protein GX591_07635, partial [Planctomycetes bacterium]|nr:hypothetical protein [Planctomycetota bacterium]